MEGPEGTMFVDRDSLATNGASQNIRHAWFKVEYHKLQTESDGKQFMTAIVYVKADCAGHRGVNGRARGLIRSSGACR